MIIPKLILTMLSGDGWRVAARLKVGVAGRTG